MQTAEDRNEKRLELAVQIMAGLLASGHFTTTRCERDEIIPEIMRLDYGEGWEADGQTCRFQSECVLQAADLVDELEKELLSRLPPSEHKLKRCL